MLTDDFQNHNSCLFFFILFFLISHTYTFLHPVWNVFLVMTIYYVFSLTGVNLRGYNMEGACTQVHFYVRFQSDGAAGWRLARLSAQLVWGAARCSTTSRATSTAERKARLNWTRYQTTGRALLHRSRQVAGERGRGILCLKARAAASVGVIPGVWMVISPDGQAATWSWTNEQKWSKWPERC